VDEKDEVLLQVGHFVAMFTAKNIDLFVHLHVDELDAGELLAWVLLKTISRLVGLSEHCQLRVPQSIRIAFVWQWDIHFVLLNALNRMEE
jgi:hypothetical protein